MSVDVSIIIPVHDKVEYLGACVDSALAQEGVGLEVICVDDASTDGSLELLERMAGTHGELKVLRNERNLGPGMTRNRGLEAATGSFLRFVDADDLIPADSTAALLHRAVADGSELVRGSLAMFQGTDPATVTERVTVPERASVKLEYEEILWIPWWHTTYLISADLVRRHGIAYPDLRRGEDPVFLANLLVHASSISMLSKTVYRYRKYPKLTGSASTSLAGVLDTIAHARLVRDLFAPRHARCWEEGYGPYILEDLRRVLARSALDDAAMARVESEMAKVWT